MESLELLAKLYGQELFYKSLIVDVFCEDTWFIFDLISIAYAVWIVYVDILWN